MFKLSEDFKHDVMNRIGLFPFSEPTYAGKRSGYYDLFDEAKKFVYGYAKTVAKEELKNQLWTRNNVPPGQELVVPVVFPSVPPVITITPYPSITWTGTYPNLDDNTYTYTSNANSIMKTFTSNAAPNAIFNISSISDRISSKTKELLSNVRK